MGDIASSVLHLMKYKSVCRKIFGSQFDESQSTFLTPAFFVKNKRKEEREEEREIKKEKNK